MFDDRDVLLALVECLKEALWLVNLCLNVLEVRP